MLELEDSTNTMWTKDQPFVIDDGTPGTQTYGAHPLYLNKEKSHKFNLVYLRNSNAMDVVISSTDQLYPGGKEYQKQITYKTIGGILDFKFFLGDTPEEAVVQYHKYIGGWSQQPFWSFGFHQCRWGYKSLSKLREVVSNHRSATIPIDTIWSDIDYMDHYQDFTVNEAAFPPADLKAWLKEEKLHYVPIIDAGIAIGDSKAYQEGLKQNAYIRNAKG